MKKNLANPVFENELRQSAFFREAAARREQEKQEQELKTVRNSERKSERNSVRKSKPKTEKPPLPIKRLSRRYSFEIYDDQITKLKRLKRRAEDKGQKLTLSDMARQALDDYLEDQ